MFKIEFQNCICMFGSTIAYTMDRLLLVHLPLEIIIKIVSYLCLDGYYWTDTDATLEMLKCGQILRLANSHPSLLFLKKYYYTLIAVENLGLRLTTVGLKYITQCTSLTNKKILHGPSMFLHYYNKNHKLPLIELNRKTEKIVQKCAVQVFADTYTLHRFRSVSLHQDIWSNCIYFYVNKKYISSQPTKEYYTYVQQLNQKLFVDRADPAIYDYLMNNNTSALVRKSCQKSIILE